VVSAPRLTFACELDHERLTELFADPAVIADLKALNAGITMMVSDFSAERAAVVKRLNDAGVPVIGIPLFPANEGYYFTVDNAPDAASRYQLWKEWTARHGLVWAGVGLDIEPEARFYEQIMANPWGLVGLLAPRLVDAARPRRARALYAALIDRIHADGWQVENYQFPMIADERHVGSTLLQRLLGLVDVRTDREVWMLYSSFMRHVGPGLLWTYGPEADAIAVGTTGGGPDVPGHPQMPTLDWDELARDLRLARRWCDDIYVHSLEGCVWQGFLPRIRQLVWSGAAPPDTTRRASVMRTGLRTFLWTTAHPLATASIAVGAFIALRQLRRPSNHQLSRRRSASPQFPD